MTQNALTSINTLASSAGLWNQKVYSTSKFFWTVLGEFEDEESSIIYSFGSTGGLGGGAFG